MTDSAAREQPTLGERIRTARLARGMSVLDVAKRVLCPNGEPTHLEDVVLRWCERIAQIEAGDASGVDCYHLDHLARAMGVSQAEHDAWCDAHCVEPRDLHETIWRAADRWNAIRSLLAAPPSTWDAIEAALHIATAHGCAQTDGSTIVVDRSAQTVVRRNERSVTVNYYEAVCTCGHHESWHDHSHLPSGGTCMHPTCHGACPAFTDGSR